MARTTPFNNEAEQAVLGSMLLDNDLIPEAITKIKDNDFYRDSHKKIFTAITEIKDKGQAADLITVSNYLKEKNELESIGGITYLNEIVDAVPTTANFKHYMDIIEEKSILRNLIKASSSIAESAYESSSDIMLTVDNAEKLIFQIISRKVKNDFTPVHSLLSNTIDKIEELNQRKDIFTGVRSGLIDLDEKTFGFQKSDLIIIAARPSVGKSALAINIAEYVGAELKKPVGLFTLEMNKESILYRLLAAQSGVDLFKIRSGHLSSQDWDPLINAASVLSESPIYIDDTPGINILELRAKARRAVKQYKFELIIIDYLQLITSSSKMKENRQQEISEISRALKALARELNIPVIALSQLSRKAEDNAGEPPKLSHLRESGAIEQDADVVIFIHRESKNRKDEDDASVNENVTDYKLIIAKQRNGPTGEVDVKFFKNTTKFVSAQKSKDAVYV